MEAKKGSLQPCWRMMCYLEHHCFGIPGCGQVNVPAMPASCFCFLSIACYASVIIKASGGVSVWRQNSSSN